MIELKMPWPPSANRYWRYIPGRVLISKEAREYKRSIKILSRFWKLKVITGRLRVFIKVCPPDKRVRDLDNYQKITLDALQGAYIFENDSQIDDLHTIRGPITKGGLLHITISKLDEGYGAKTS